MSHDKDHETSAEEHLGGYGFDVDDADDDDGEDLNSHIELVCKEMPCGHYSVLFNPEVFSLLDSITRSSDRSVDEVLLDALSLLVERKPRTHGGMGAWEKAVPASRGQNNVLAAFPVSGDEMTALRCRVACSRHPNADLGAFIGQYLREHTQVLQMPAESVSAGETS